jgi:hypothetical protein
MNLRIPRTLLRGDQLASPFEKGGEGDFLIPSFILNTPWSCYGDLECTMKNARYDSQLTGGKND